MYKHSEKIKQKLSLIKMNNPDAVNHIQEFCELYESGLTSYEIADRFNVSRSYITNKIKQSGIKLRKGGNKKGYVPWNKGKPYYAIRGEKNPRWKGGITSLNQQIRHCIEYKNWVRTIFKRDDWTCKCCKKRGGDLEVDHYPKMFYKIISDNKIKNYQEAILCDELWDLDNGRTLCKKCHNKTKSN